METAQHLYRVFLKNIYYSTSAFVKNGSLFSTTIVRRQQQYDKINKVYKQNKGQRCCHLFAYRTHTFAKSWKNDFGHLNDEEVLDKKKVTEICLSY